MTVLYLLALFVVAGLFIAFRWGSPDGCQLWKYILFSVILSALVFLFLLYARGALALPIGKSWLLRAHLFFITLSYAAAASSAGAACALAIQDYCLQNKKPLPPFPVPSLASADAAVYRLSALSFTFLCMSLLLALLMVKGHWGVWRWEARTFGALVICVFYAVALHMRRIAGWRGLRLASFVFLLYLLLLLVPFLAFWKMAS